MEIIASASLVAIAVNNLGNFSYTTTGGNRHAVKLIEFSVDAFLRKIKKPEIFYVSFCF